MGWAVNPWANWRASPDNLLNLLSLLHLIGKQPVPNLYRTTDFF